MKRFLLALGALVTLTVCIVVFNRMQGGSKEEKVVYTYLKPELRDLKQTVTVNGSISPVLSTQIKSEVSGRIAKVLVNAGDHVTEGQPLVELDQSTLKVQIDEARLGIEASRLRTEQARLDFERSTKLAEQSYINEKEREDAEIAYKLAQNSLETQQARVRLLENSLGKTSISAPYEGTILSVAARPGMVVTGADAGREGNTLFELADLSNLRVEASVNEIDVAGLSLSLPVDIEFESVPEAKASGEITFIAPAAGISADGTSSSGQGGGANNRRDFPILVRISHSHPKVRPGMTARIHIVTAEVSQALSIDSVAVYRDADNKKDVVYLKDGDNPPAEHEIETGISDGTYVEIKSGLTAEQEVARQRPPKKDDGKTANKNASASS